MCVTCVCFLMARTEHQLHVVFCCCPVLIICETN